MLGAIFLFDEGIPDGILYLVTIFILIVPPGVYGTSSPSLPFNRIISIGLSFEDLDELLS
jgi:hypothetical protein